MFFVPFVTKKVHVVNGGWHDRRRWCDKLDDESHWETGENQKTKFVEGPKPKNKKAKNSNLKIAIQPSSSCTYTILLFSS